eukprot:351168-Chlamydomonas_euryale.AAC.8
MVEQFGQPRPCSAGASHTRAVAGLASLSGQQQQTAAGCPGQRQISRKQRPLMLRPSATCGGTSGMTTSGWRSSGACPSRGCKALVAMTSWGHTSAVAAGCRLRTARCLRTLGETRPSGGARSRMLSCGPLVKPPVRPSTCNISGSCRRRHRMCMPALGRRPCVLRL